MQNKLKSGIREKCNNINPYGVTHVCEALVVCGDAMLGKRQRGLREPEARLPDPGGLASVRSAPSLPLERPVTVAAPYAQERVFLRRRLRADPGVRSPTGSTLNDVVCRLLRDDSL